VRARFEDLRLSRARLVETADAERRRLERNLHDRAQQRLVTLSMSLGLAQRRFADHQPTQQLLEQTCSELAGALAELRELARGIHPAVLTEHGLGPALHALAGRAHVPVDVRELPTNACRPASRAAYYLVAETLTNIAKYAQASAATVRARIDDNHLLEVTDDGMGGATRAAEAGSKGSPTASTHSTASSKSPTATPSWIS
jgi:signal transduction histidine kinase